MPFLAVGLLMCAPRATEASAWTEALAFKARYSEGAGDLQDRLNGLYEGFGQDPGSDTDKAVHDLLLPRTNAWVSVDRVLDCVDEADRNQAFGQALGDCVVELHGSNPFK